MKMWTINQFHTIRYRIKQITEDLHKTQKLFLQTIRFKKYKKIISIKLEKTLLLKALNIYKIEKLRYTHHLLTFRMNKETFQFQIINLPKLQITIKNLQDITISKFKNLI